MSLSCERPFIIREFINTLLTYLLTYVPITPNTRPISSLRLLTEGVFQDNSQFLSREPQIPRVSRKEWERRGWTPRTREVETKGLVVPLTDSGPQYSRSLRRKDESTLWRPVRSETNEVRFR